MRLEPTPTGTAGGHFEIFSRVEVRVTQNDAADQASTLR